LLFHISETIGESIGLRIAFLVAFPFWYIALSEERAFTVTPEDEFLLPNGDAALVTDNLWIPALVFLHARQRKSFVV
jgi:hypothetical protein